MTGARVPAGPKEADGPDTHAGPAAQLRTALRHQPGPDPPRKTVPPREGPPDPVVECKIVAFLRHCRTAIRGADAATRLAGTGLHGHSAAHGSAARGAAAGSELRMASSSALALLDLTNVPLILPDGTQATFDAAAMLRDVRPNWGGEKPAAGVAWTQLTLDQRASQGAGVRGLGLKGEEGGKEGSLPLTARSLPSHPRRHVSRKGPRRSSARAPPATAVA